MAADLVPEPTDPDTMEAPMGNRWLFRHDGGLDRGAQDPCDAVPGVSTDARIRGTPSAATDGFRRPTDLESDRIAGDHRRIRAGAW